MISKHKSQQQFANRFKISSWLFDSKVILTINGGGNTLNNLHDSVNLLSKGGERVMRHLLNCAHRLRYIRFAQATMAKDLGYTREHFNRLLKELKDAGLIHYEGPHREVCNYWVNGMFLLPFIRLRFKWLFVSLALVFNFNITQLKKNGTHNKPTIKSVLIFDNLKQYPPKEKEYPHIFWHSTFESPPDW